MKSHPVQQACRVLLLLFGALLFSRHAFAQSAATAPHPFGLQQGHFVLNGKPFQIISGEMHYARIPRAYWRNRLRMARAMGLNTVSTYVFWNQHEQVRGLYDFSGQNDVAEFIREAQQEGLYVILRPGPYVCAEWEWGGYPAWLLADPNTIVRSSDPRYMEPVSTWLRRLGQELAPLQVGRGGPILAVQVENEYGSFGQDHAYMEQMHHALLDAGFTSALLYTADGPAQVPNGSLPELPAVINFGVGEARESFHKLAALRPGGPFMSGEYWDGWFDHWGQTHQTTSVQASSEEVAWMLGQGFSINLYMFHGGTSFGWMNGANFSASDGYQPDVTSYDYDAPLSESGQPTPKFFALRKVILAATGTTLPEPPAPPPTQTVPRFSLSGAASLWSVLPHSIASDDMKTMEALGQAYGYLLYRTTLPSGVQGQLVLKDLHDFAQVYLDGHYVGSMDRRLGQDRLTLTATVSSARLDILVENTGRVNFTKAIRGERVGVLGGATLDGAALGHWQTFSLPMSDTADLLYTTGPCAGPCFYHGKFTAASAADTFLDTAAFHKGFVWLNGHPLGRIWDIGPQRTLYAPGPWLRKGSNDVVVFDLDGVSQASMQGLGSSILDAPLKVPAATH